MATSVPPAAVPTPRALEPGPIRVMLVDDSAVIRSMIRQILMQDPGISVVASASNGQAALQLVASSEIHVVVLDIEMPVMDGLTAIPKLIELNPDIKIIIASTLSQRNAEISLKALALGAADYIPKPSSAREIAPQGDFHRELISKVKSLGARRRIDPNRAAAPAAQAAPVAAPAPYPRATAPKQIVLRKAGIIRPQVIAIGSSTGGPQALLALLKAIPASVDVPIVITQHMPPTFTRVLAEHIARACGRPCLEAVAGEALKAGRIYVAPGDHHLLLDPGPDGPVARLTKDPPENFCRPAVDPMLRSLAQTLGAKVLTIILTGMGSDGMKGAHKIVEAGGTVIAQDEASSVVWGMPGAVATAGLCAAVLPLAEIAPYVTRMFSGHRHELG